MRDDYDEALRKAQRKAAKKQEVAERTREFVEMAMKWSAVLAPVIRQATDAAVARYRNDFAGIGELVVLDDEASIEPFWLDGASVYFVPDGSESFDTVRKRYFKEGFGNWPENRAMTQIHYSLASTRLDICVIGPNVEIHGRVMQETQQESKDYWCVTDRNPRQVRMPHLTVPADSFDTSVIEKALRDWLTVILKDKVSMTPRHRLT